MDKHCYIYIDQKKILLTAGAMFHVKNGKAYYGIEIIQIIERKYVLAKDPHDNIYIRYRNTGLDDRYMEADYYIFTSMIRNYYETARAYNIYQTKFIPAIMRDGFLKEFEHREKLAAKALRTRIFMDFEARLTNNLDYL